MQAALAYRDRLRNQPQRRESLRLWLWHHRQDLLHGLDGWRPRLQELKRLRRFLRERSDSLLTFLAQGNAATNWRAEQALRPAVVNRKVWGGNRTDLGSRVQSTLMTVLGTLERQHHHLLATLSQALCRGTLRLRLAS